MEKRKKKTYQGRIKLIKSEKDICNITKDVYFK